VGAPDQLGAMDAAKRVALAAKDALSNLDFLCVTPRGGGSDSSGDTVFADYASGFAPASRDEPFVVYYSVGQDKALKAERYTRGEFYDLALRAAHVITAHGVGAGECQTHFFSCNTLGDLAFRLASVMLGTTPVTINWQADTADRVLYKTQITASKLVLIDDETPTDVVAMLREQAPSASIFNVKDLTAQPMLPTTEAGSGAPTEASATRIVIFTSGTTGNPKGVRLSYRSYQCNQRTFESFLQAGEDKKLVAVVVNPMHHTNSTSITDWAMRKPGAVLHLVQRYTTQYWSVLARAGTPVAISDTPSDAQFAAALEQRNASGTTVVVAPLVSRHFDFLDSLISTETLPVPPALMHTAMSHTILLLGSAPVGPTTVERMRKYAGKLPTVRFGSTETCLQVMGTPLYLSESERLAAFQAGWAHAYRGQEQVGYYIGRPHPPYTECRVVRSLDKVGGDFIDAEDGEPGQLITRGNNLMSGYVGNDAATAKALDAAGWYTNLGDVCFRLRSAADGGFDYYWLSRDSALLIRGGANYAYEQINNELKAFLVKTYGIPAECTEVAVIGMRVESEHEDACCATVELTGEGLKKQEEIEKSFLKLAKKGVSKGAKPDHLRVSPLPRNFKGVVKLPDLKEEWGKQFASKKATAG